LAATTVALGCGPGQLAGAGDEAEPAETSTESADESLGESSSTDSTTETETETETGDEDPPMPTLPEACALVRVEGDAVVPIDAHTVSGPRLTALRPGDAETPARVMLIEHEYVGDDRHGNYRARSFVLEQPWPEGVVETEVSLRLTNAGHSLSRLARLADGEHRFAYVYNGDPDGLNDYDTFFAILDTQAWSVGGLVEIESSTNPSFVDVLRTGERFVTTYTSVEHDSLPDGELSGFSLGTLDADGTALVGATELTASAPSPGSAVRTFWAGDRVAAAISHNDCHIDDHLCFPHSLVLARPSAPDQHGAAVDGFEAGHVIDGLPTSGHVSRAQVFVEHGLTWLLWYEGDDWLAVDEHRTFRALVLDQGGDPIPWPPANPAPGPISFVEDTATRYWPVAFVSEFGVTVVFQTSDGLFEIRHHDFEFEPLGEPILIDLGGSSARYPGIAVLAEPRSLLLGWGEQIVQGPVSVRMIRLECE